MSDEIDKTVERESHLDQLAIDQCRAAAQLDPGKQGECELCSEWSGRLVNGVCAPCRDKYGLP